MEMNDGNGWSSEFFFQWLMNNISDRIVRLVSLCVSWEMLSHAATESESVFLPGHIFLTCPNNSSIQVC